MAAVYTHAPAVLRAVPCTDHNCRRTRLIEVLDSYPAFLYGSTSSGRRRRHCILELSMARKYLFLPALAASLCLVSACQAPCDGYCEATAEYIGYCLDNGSQGEWVAADWSHWGDFSSAEDFVADCQADLAAQVDAGDGDVIQSTCTDQDNAYREMADRGLCADLP